MQEGAVALPKACAGCGARYPADALFCAVDGMPLHQASFAQHGLGDSALDPYLGREISGHIEIRQLVGVGAMGRVYRAFQKGIDRDVAVKILHRELSGTAQLVSRFNREAKVASRLQHPNVVQVLLAGQLPDGALYMVMEYLEGLSLQSALAAAGGAFPLPRALHVTMQLCEAVGEAHAVGIVHRDLKPENVMLVRRGTDPDFVKVLDFGIARMEWTEQSVATAAGLVFGTPRYISPEGAQGQVVGPAGDVYSIATLLYQMLAGRTPFEGDQAVSVLVQQIHDSPPTLTAIGRASYVPQPLSDVIMANLAKEANHRESDARSFGHALVDAAKQAGLSPDDISRPILQRKASAMQLPPTERTKKFDFDVELREQSPKGSHGSPPLTAATAKWEPPVEFQARLNEAIEVHRSVAARPSSGPMASAPFAGAPPPKASHVDETLDDATAEPPYASPPRPIPTLPSVVTAFPAAIDEVSRGRTDYAPPATEDADVAAYESRFAPRRMPHRAFLVLVCFMVGMAIAALWAWRAGKLGTGDDERYVARATDAMFKSQYVLPPGDNVRDITDDGLRKWPNHSRLLDVRRRASNALVSQATTQRANGDVVEALRLARVAYELDSTDPSVKRLIEQCEAELAVSTTSAAPPLPKEAVVAAAPAKAPAAASPSTPSTPPVALKTSLEFSTSQPKLGQTVEFVARVAPSKGSFEGAAFHIAGPGLGAGVSMAAQNPAPGVFRVSYAFLVGGRFDVTFAARMEGKAIHTVRSLTVGESAPKPPDPAPTSSVKWM